MFKKLKSLFIEEEEGKKTPEKPTETPQEVEEVPENQVLVEMPTVGPGKVSDKFTDILVGALEKNNIEGFDYLEFKKSLQSLSKMPMDEATRYKSAYAMAQTMGITPQKLVDTAQFYLNVLQKEEKKFLQAMASQKSKQIGNKQQNLHKLDELIKNKTAQIKQLTEDIEKHQKEKVQMTQEISNSSVKVESTKANFDVTYDLLVSQIKQDIDNIKNYLK